MEAKGAPYDASLSLITTASSSSSMSSGVPTVVVDDDTSPLSPSGDRLGSLTPPAEQDAEPSVSARPGGRSPSSSSRPSKSGADREKRKRSRVTPEQLAHLERFFSLDRSPTAARRKEISQMLGMQERQTQIWFQNRRAKAKLLDGKSKPKSDSAPPHTPPELRQGYETELHKLIHEEDAITIIPCYELTIGNWRRIATQVGKHDLVTYVCESRRCFVWYIQSSGYGFKIEVPFNLIKDTTYQTTMPGRGLASFYLTQPPLFFIEDLVSVDGSYSGQRTWKRSADWTEGSQASHELRHDVVGSSVQLAHVLRHFNLPVSSSSSELAQRSPTDSISTPSILSTSSAYEPLPVPRLSDPSSFSHGSYPEASSTLRSSAVNPIEVPRRSSYNSLASVSIAAADPHDYAADRAPSSHPGPSLQPSPAPSYASYSQLAPSPGPASYSSASPGPHVSQYSTPTAMYPSSHSVLDDPSHGSLSRPYGASAYSGLSSSAPTSATHAHFAPCGIAPSTSPHIMPASYTARPELGIHAPHSLVPQPSGLVGEPGMLRDVHYDDGARQHHNY